MERNKWDCLKSWCDTMIKHLEKEEFPQTLFDTEKNMLITEAQLQTYQTVAKVMKKYEKDELRDERITLHEIKNKMRVSYIIPAGISKEQVEKLIGKKLILDRYTL